MNKKTDEFARKFRTDLLDLIEGYKQELAPYEVGYAMIDLAVSALLTCAPRDAVAYKILFACLEQAIKNHYEGEDEETENQC